MKNSSSWDTWESGPTSAPEVIPTFPWAQTILSGLLAALVFEHIAGIRPRQFTVMDNSTSGITTVSAL